MNLSNIQNYSDQDHIMDLLIQQNAKSQDAELV